MSFKTLTQHPKANSRKNLQTKNSQLPPKARTQRKDPIKTELMERLRTAPPSTHLSFEHSNFHATAP